MSNKRGLIIIIIYSLLYEGFQVLFKVDSKFFPRITDIIGDIISNFSYYFSEIISTFITILFGLIPAILIGYLLAFTGFHNRILNAFLNPLINVTQLVPKTALIPIFVAIPFLGYDIESKVLMTFLICFFPVFIEVMHGLSLISPELRRYFESIHSDKKQIICYLEIPATIPYFFNGIKISILYSVIGAVTSEIIIGGEGLGYLIDISASKLFFVRAFGGVICCILLGYLLLSIFNIQKKLFFRNHAIK